jgi:ligand-binding SRPBCC domain-containing protein
VNTPIDRVWEFYTDILHRFSNIDKYDRKQTEIIDEVEFEIPYSRIGKLYEGYAYTRLQKLFDYRKEATVRALEGKM